MLSRAVTMSSLSDERSFAGFSPVIFLSGICQEKLAVLPYYEGKMPQRVRESNPERPRKPARFPFKSAGISALNAFTQNRRIVDSRRITQFPRPNLSEKPSRVRDSCDRSAEPQRECFGGRKAPLHFARGRQGSRPLLRWRGLRYPDVGH